MPYCAASILHVFFWDFHSDLSVRYRDVLLGNPVLVLGFT